MNGAMATAVVAGGATQHGQNNAVSAQQSDSINENTLTTALKVVPKIFRLQQSAGSDRKQQAQ